MNLLVALLLGLVQGLTEFFPVSSSAHLKLMKILFGIKDVPIIFDLACHLGTLFALLWFFKSEITHILKKDRTKLKYLFAALLPLLPCYFFLAPIREMVSKPEFLGLFMMLTGGILLVGQKVRIKKKKSLLRDVLLIGTMQSAALIPGISRSASTISAAQVLGWEVKDAVRFSFLLAIPTILGGNLLEIERLWKKGQMIQLMNLHCFVGFITSLIIGLMVIRFAINWLEKGKLQMFAWYCLVIGMLVNVYIYLK
ncbi:MAG: Undecaprenyl-diphosphatase [Chlamydiae bacterium]|nr:Undecaprenyl-diphosphatase [Chlamydiota bacterium]NGX47185.1 Undecaprenyl-diphosphatase [Chlamydiota bacterium]